MIVNGAGLAMSTMDLIKLKHGQPANFMDISGKVDVEEIDYGFQLLAHNRDIDVIFLNIFGGIVNCQKVADGIITALTLIESNRTRHNLRQKLKGHIQRQGLMRETHFYFDPEMPLPHIVMRLNGNNASLASEMIHDYTLTNPNIDITLEPDFDLASELAVEKAKDKKR